VNIVKYELTLLCTRAAMSNLWAQGCQIGRFAAKFQITEIWPYFKLVARTCLGWPFDLFWPFFKGHLVEKFFCWPILKICRYFKI